MVAASYLARGVLRSSEHCMNPSKGIHVDQMEINKQSSYIHARTHMTRSLVECVERFTAKKTHWATEKPMLENARKLKGIDSVGPSDMEFKDTMKNARKKLQAQMESAMPCKS